VDPDREMTHRDTEGAEERERGLRGVGSRLWWYRLFRLEVLRWRSAMDFPERITETQRRRQGVWEIRSL